MHKKLDIHKNLHILVVHDKNKNIFIAHCLDMDIASQSKTQQEAVSELKRLIYTQIEYCVENDILDTLFRPAPKEYWDIYYRSQATGILNQLSLQKNKHTIKDVESDKLLGFLLKNFIGNKQNQFTQWYKLDRLIKNQDKQGEFTEYHTLDKSLGHSRKRMPTQIQNPTPC